jgi:hypothetical protein
VNISELVFANPDFEITLVEKKEQKQNDHQKPLQSLFGDILSRGEIP